MPDWATHQVIRMDGRVEDYCIHQIGHTNKHWLKVHDPDGSKMLGVHGCDSCCCEGDDLMTCNWAVYDDDSELGYDCILNDYGRECDGSRDNVCYNCYEAE